MIPSKAEIGGLKQMKSNVLGDDGSRDLGLKKGDFCPEIYFIGQIVGGSDFSVFKDGLFIESYLNFGEDWTHNEDDNSGPI